MTEETGTRSGRQVLLLIMVQHLLRALRGKNHVLLARILLGGAFAALLLSSCGGGAGDPAPVVTEPPPPDPPPGPTGTYKAEGIWSGTTLVRCDAYPVLGLITREKGLFIATPVGIFVGSIADETLNVTAIRYDRADGAPLVLSANSGAPALKITNLKSSAYLSVQWLIATDLCTWGGIELTYDGSLYERPSSLALVAGVYTDGSLTLAVNSDGVVTGSYVNGCVLNGNVGVVHEDRNYYSLAIDVANCPASGSYEGAAFLRDGEVTNNVLQIIAANPDHAIWRRLVK